ncbi:MAG: hypothetical protein U1F72_05330 [Gammaproteobacteria bacterium]
MKKRYLFALLIYGCLGGCAEQGCQSFASQETTLCIPSKSVLGSLWFLGKVSRNEIGFRMGEAASADLVTVTLTRRDYFCRRNEGSRFCRPGVSDEREDQEGRDVIRVYSNEQKSFWDYQISGVEGGHSVANCSAIPNQPDVGRCILAGAYKDIIYSAIFIDTRTGGALRVRSDVEQQIRHWEVSKG